MATSALPARELEIVEPGDTVWCECGNRKQSIAVGCARCRYLDGARPSAAAVIAALRQIGDLTLTELCMLVHGSAEHGKRTAMIHLLKRMREQGRVRRYLDGTDGRDIGTGVHSYRGFEMRRRVGAVPRYVYRLTEPGRSA